MTPPGPCAAPTGASGRPCLAAPSDRWLFGVDPIGYSEQEGAGARTAPVLLAPGRATAQDRCARAPASHSAWRARHRLPSAPPTPEPSDVRPC